jgi:hypothetical protein
MIVLYVCLLFIGYDDGMLFVVVRWFRWLLGIIVISIIVTFFLSRKDILPRLTGQFHNKNNAFPNLLTIYIFYATAQRTTNNVAV